VALGDTERVEDTVEVVVPECVAETLIDAVGLDDVDVVDVAEIELVADTVLEDVADAVADADKVTIVHWNSARGAAATPRYS